MLFKVLLNVKSLNLLLVSVYAWLSYLYCFVGAQLFTDTLYSWSSVLAAVDNRQVTMTCPGHIRSRKTNCTATIKGCTMEDNISDYLVTLIFHFPFCILDMLEFYTLTFTQKLFWILKVMGEKKASSWIFAVKALQAPGKGQWQVEC